MDLDKKTTGAWLVHHANKLANYNQSAEFENVRLAGRSGVLLSALSSNDQSTLSNDQVKALAIASQINTTFELPIIIEHLAAHKLIDKSASGIGVLGLTTETVLKHTTDIFTEKAPTPFELASIDLAEVCSTEPTSGSDLSGFISDSYGIAGGEANRLLIEAETYGFTDAEEVQKGERVFFNGNLFRKDELKKIDGVLSSLNAVERQHVQEVDGLLKARGCILLQEAQKVLGETLLKKLSSIGMYDVNIVSNAKENTAFITRPSAFSKFGNASVADAFDLAKALVASLSYGIHRSTPGRGRIRMIEALMKKLIRGQSVGPATAIGQDYKVLEMKNVVAVEHQGTMFSMRLLKREVGVLALQLLTEGDASEQSLPNFPGAAVTKYTSPEETRSRVRMRQRELKEKEVGSILQALRTGRHLR
jgi:hypothetical protein